MASKKKAGKAAGAKKGAAKKGACAKQPPSISDEEALRRIIACGFNGSPGIAAMLPCLARSEDPCGGESGEAEKRVRKGRFGWAAGGALALACGSISVLSAAVSVAAACSRRRRP